MFKEEEGKEKRTWWKVLIKTYVAYSFTGFFLQNLLLYLWIDILNISRYMSSFVPFFENYGLNITEESLATYVAPFINMLVTIPLNYVINKYWAYRQKETKKSELEGNN